MPSPPAPDLLRLLRAHHEGTLLFADRSEPVRFVIDPASGQPVMPVPGFVLSCDAVTLCAPDDSFDNPDCLQVLAEPVEVDPQREPACDRHAAYFGRPAHARFARLTVHSVKRLGEVIDGDLVRLANPLARHEGALCKLANAAPDLVADLVARASATRPEHPMVVGVDPWGIDVRARFGVIRVEFPAPVSTDTEARAALESLLHAA
jgi:hypothetical protein